MLRSFKLLLPALIPSWRFFDVIAPSPRIEFALLNSQQDVATHWQEFRPKPMKLSFTAMLGRLFWNPNGNEALFLVSCAERMMENPTDRHSCQEIVTRIKNDIKNSSDAIIKPYLQFRLICISRHGADLRKDIIFLSDIYSFDGAVS